MKTLHMEMVQLDDWYVPLSKRGLPDGAQIVVAADKISGEPKLVLTLISKGARATYETTDADVGQVRWLLQNPVTILRLKLRQ